MKYKKDKCRKEIKELFEILMLQREINKLTVDDFDFNIGTTIGTINPNEIKIINTKKKIDNTVEYTISIPCVNDYYDNYNVLKKPVTKNIPLLDLSEYKKYQEMNDKYDFVEVEVFYIRANLKNNKLLTRINQYIRDYNYKFAIQKNEIPYSFLYCNWNIPPFITEEKQFTEDDKQRLFENIKALLLQAVRVR